MTAAGARRTVPALSAMAHAGEKIAMLTCYDASFATVLDRAGVDALLIGDSLGMVIGGHASTLPVTLDEMIYHTRCWRRVRGRRSCWPTCRSAATRQRESRRTPTPPS
jgi:ketopantoate hydroxymethyltransferase